MKHYIMLIDKQRLEIVIRNHGTIINMHLRRLVANNVYYWNDNHVISDNRDSLRNYGKLVITDWKKEIESRLEEVNKLKIITRY